LKDEELVVAYFKRVNKAEMRPGIWGGRGFRKFVDEEKYHLEMWGENSLLTWGGPLRKEFLRC